MRYSITKEEYEIIMMALQRDTDNNQEAIDILKKRDRESMKRYLNSKKINATENANDAKISASRENIKIAVNCLRLKEKKITAYSVAKEASISFNTAKKYESYIEFLVKEEERRLKKKNIE